MDITYYCLLIFDLNVEQMKNKAENLSKFLLVAIISCGPIVSKCIYSF